MATAGKDQEIHALSFLQQMCFVSPFPPAFISFMLVWQKEVMTRHLDGDVQVLEGAVL